MHEHHLLGEVPKCPHCKRNQDGAYGKRRAPVNGDYCICVYCATISRYLIKDNNYTLIIATEKDFQIALEDGIYIELMAAQQLVKSKIKKQ